MPKEVEFYPEPLLTCWNEIESRLADQLPGAYVDASLKSDPKKLADTVHKWAVQTDQILKEADLYGALRMEATAGTLPAAGRAMRLRRVVRLRRWRIPIFCYIALLPVLALFFYVRVVPIGFGFLLSFYRWNLVSPRKPFVGWANYEALLGDENFHLALKNTTIYSFSTVLLSTAIALPLAVFLARRSRLSAFYQTVYFLPVITPLVPMSIAWKWIYDYNYGVLNYGLSLVGLPRCRGSPIRTSRSGRW